MDTYYIVCVIITAVSLTAAYSVGKRRKTPREAQNEFDGAANS